MITKSIKPNVGQWRGPRPLGLPTLNPSLLSYIIYTYTLSYDNVGFYKTYETHLES